ncbi:ATP-dependent DNA ligase [bacterium]|nr:ATP-dependent DNA ligase [bacterium]
MQDGQLSFDWNDTENKEPITNQKNNNNDEGTLKFSVVAQTFEKIEQVNGRLKITQLLANLLQKATPDEASAISYLSLGRLHPPYIGTQFQIAEKSLISVIAHLTKQSDKAIKQELKELGDIGLLLQDRVWEQTGDLSVLQVYSALEAIEKISGTGSQEAKVNSLEQLLKNLDVLSAKFVVRIVMGKLRLGFSDMTIIDALSWMEVGDKSLRKIIENAYNICADIGFITKKLKNDGIKALEQMMVRVGTPIRPAAAERLPTAKAIVEKIGDCVAQPKLDGFRLQIHVDKTGEKPKIEFFSRNLLDMTPMFPDLTKAVETLDVKELICEGEAIVFDTNTGSFLPFQETVKRKRKHGIEKAMEKMPLRVFLFDLLYLDGQEYLSKTHAQRRKKMLSLFQDSDKNTVQVVDEKKITTSKQLEDYFNENISAGLEGLVVKREDSVYRPGKRNFSWIKLKRQEEGHLEDTIDCVILGYYAGKGKRARFGIGAFLVGVFNQNEDRFETVAKIGTGLSDVQWVELKKKCDVLSVSDKPSNLVCPKELFPDVWTAPELICLVRADEITVSPLHTSGKTEKDLGYALRFPRFMGYRPDKSADQATTVKEIKSLYKDQFVK